MLIGDVLYYNVEGVRLDYCDSSVLPAYAHGASRAHVGYVMWSCRNGDPRDVRYFNKGQQITEAELPTTLRSK